MNYYDEYDRDLMEYENELYKDPTEENDEESEIDSEIEDKLLSAIHYSSDLIGNNQQKHSQSQLNSPNQNESDINNSLNTNSYNSLKKNTIIDKTDIPKNKSQKPNVINSENLIPASIYNEAKSKAISKSALSNIYNFDSDEENNEDDKDSNIKRMDEDSEEENSKLGHSLTSLNKKNENNINNNNIDNDNNNVEIFEDFTNQPLSDIKIVTVNENDESNSKKEEIQDSEEEYITHVILPNNLEEEKSVSTSITTATDNFDEDLDNKKGTTRYFAPQAKKEVVCYFCRQAGHLSVDCDQKKTLCPICKENHDPLKCPYSNACLKCACIGHQSRDCPNLWQRQNCKFCYEVHNTVECPYLWRRYNINIYACNYTNVNVNRFCYNCGSKGHFGDECDERRYNRAFKVSAQSIKNEDPIPITNEELEAWHYDKEKQNSFSLKRKHNHGQNHNQKHSHSSSSNRNRNNDDYYDDYSNKRKRNRKRSRNQDYDDSDNDYYYKNDYKQNKSSRSSSRSSEKYNHSNSKSKSSKNNNNNHNNSNNSNNNKRRKSNYSFNSTKPSIRSRLNI